MNVQIDGLEAEVERLVNRALDKRTTEWFTTKGAADYTGLAPGTLRNLASSGGLPRYGDAGTRLRFKRSDLDCYMEGWRRVVTSPAVDAVDATEVESSMPGFDGDADPRRRPRIPRFRDSQGIALREDRPSAGRAGPPSASVQLPSG